MAITSSGIDCRPGAGMSTSDCLQGDDASGQPSEPVIKRDILGTQRLEPPDEGTIGRFQYSNMPPRARRGVYPGIDLGD